MLADYWHKYGRFVFLGVGFGLIILGLLISSWEKNKTSSIEFIDAQQSETSANTDIAVYLAGAVNNPGVYEMPANSRLHQLINKSGGYTSQVDSQWLEKNLNLARKLRDGEKIYVPKQGEVLAESKIQGSNLVSLNQADQQQLETLSGVGPATAKKIIDYRQKNNGFVSIEEIQAVDGIGPKTFAELKDKISI